MMLARAATFAAGAISTRGATLVGAGTWAPGQGVAIGEVGGVVTVVCGNPFPSAACAADGATAVGDVPYAVATLRMVGAGEVLHGDGTLDGTLIEALAAAGGLPEGETGKP